jgi:DNA polymerase-3 subunit gamma/tau
MAVLYRKYRPQTFAEVLNQKPIIQTLKNQVKSGTFSHAYLFTGGRGVGKTSVARILAKAVNCANSKDGDACGSCNVCKQIENGQFLDLVEIDAASNTGVDNIRDLIEHVKFSPSGGKYKVFIIDEVHMLSKGAFNALLKTLEEPPKHAIFILATTEINKVPATIISRTQRFDFKALTAADLLPHLEKICASENFKINREVLALIAQNADGSARDALSLLDKVMTLGESPALEDSQQLLGITDIAVCENLLELLALGRASELPDFFAQLAEKGADYTILNRDFLEYLRKVLVFKVTDGGRNFSLAENHAAKVKELAGKFSLNEVIFVIRLFLKSFKDLAGAPAAEIPLLLAALESSLKKAGPAPSANPQTLVGSNHEVGSRIQKSPSFAKASDFATQLRQGYVGQEATSDKTEGKQPQIQESIIIEEAGEVMTLPEVRDVWPKVIEEINVVNCPLASMLRSGELLDVLGSKIILGVEFLFNKQNLENPKNFNLICSVFEQVAGKKMAVAAQVIKQETAQTDPSLALTQALQVFGGELID